MGHKVKGDRMKLAGFVLLAVVCSARVQAQLIPPARDLDEAVKMIQEVGRALEPAMMAVRDDAAVLAALTAAQRKLEEEHQPATAVDEALKPIDEYMAKRRMLDFALSREMKDYLRLAREIIAAANTPPNSVGDVRERLHHKFIHPLQSRVIRNAQRLADIEQMYRYVVERQIRPAHAESLTRAGSASVEKAGPGR
jgi:hypothetical protein